MKKSSSSFLMVAGFVSEDGSMTQNDISDYVASNIKDPISRTGVGDTQVFGAQYAMRIWLDPHKLNNYQLTPVDVISALQTQNTRWPLVSWAVPPVPVSSLTPRSLLDASDLDRRVRQHHAEGQSGRLTGAPARCREN